MSESKREIPPTWRGAALEPLQEMVKGEVPAQGDMTEGTLVPPRGLALPPPPWAVLDKMLHSSLPQCILWGMNGKTRPSKGS